MKQKGFGHVTWTNAGGAEYKRGAGSVECTPKLACMSQGEKAAIHRQETAFILCFLIMDRSEKVKEKTRQITRVMS